MPEFAINDTVIHAINGTHGRIIEVMPPRRGRQLGTKQADYVHAFSPEAIILFGGLTKAGHWIMDPIRDAMEQNLLPLWKGKIPVAVSALKDSDAAILGAASLVW